MTNAINKKEYEAIKNIRNLSVVSFINNQRVSTYEGLTVISAINEIFKRQSQGCETLLIKNLPDNEISNNRDDYEKYITVSAMPPFKTISLFDGSEDKKL